MNSNFDYISNIKFFDIVKSYFIFIFRYLKAFNRYRKTYSNYFSVLRNVRNKNFPIEANLKNGKKIIIRNAAEAAIHAYGSTNFQIHDDILQIKKNNNLIQLTGWSDNADLYEIFFQNHYEIIPVENKEVIDIGSNICDSSIYFVLAGAINVIAVELLPYNCKIAKENVLLNKLENKIEILMAGCADKTGHTYFDEGKKGMGFSLDISDKNGIKIPLLTLEDLLKYSKYESKILKLDCEGCEYDVILSSSKDTLRKFDYIFIEYHFGYLNLKKKLEECGFFVHYTTPSLYYHQNLHKKSFIGYLYATKK